MQKDKPHIATKAKHMATEAENVLNKSKHKATEDWPERILHMATEAHVNAARAKHMATEAQVNATEAQTNGNKHEAGNYTRSITNS